MIYNYPDLYTDELLYSGHARYAHRIRYPNLKNIMNELFGSRHIIASIPFASHLQYFVAQQPQADRFTTDLLIAEHTLLPFYSPFLPQARVQQLNKDMCGTNGPGIYMRVGLMASIVSSPQYLQYCPECARNDRMQFGEMYWHRLHQVPGVFVCHIHKCGLSRVVYEYMTEKHVTSLYQRRRYYDHYILLDQLKPLLSYLIPCYLLLKGLLGFFNKENFL